jgi:hypothetical protein
MSIILLVAYSICSVLWIVAAVIWYPTNKAMSIASILLSIAFSSIVIGGINE